MTVQVVIVPCRAVHPDSDYMPVPFSSGWRWLKDESKRLLSAAGATAKVFWSVFPSHPVFTSLTSKAFSDFCLHCTIRVATYSGTQHLAFSVLKPQSVEVGATAKVFWSHVPTSLVLTSFLTKAFSVFCLHCTALVAIHSDTQQVGIFRFQI